MSLTCFWRYLLLTTVITVVVQADSTLYCIKHSSAALHNNNLDTCTISKGRPVSAAALKSDGNTNISTNNKLSFELTCNSDPTTCAAISSTFTKATEIISSVFQFETPLLINASFLDFCQEYQDCSSDNKMTSIGQAYPAISYVMTDTADNMTRMYPQPLLKQFTDLTVKPTWTKYDINAQFNTLVNWYFINDQQAIRSDQTDFLRTVLHELIHGLGFITSWSDDVYRAITPLFPQPDNINPFITPILLASTNNEELLDGYNNPLPFWGFVEFPFDKLLYYKADSSNGLYPFSKITSQLNQFSNSNVIFRNLIDLANSWYDSKAYSQAIKLYQRSVTKLNVLTVIDGHNQAMWVESSVSPYSTGSSLCHVDESVYLDSKEYLMVYTANHGIGMTQLDQFYPSGPIGPKLQTIMGALGYRLSALNVKTTRPALTYWHPPPGLVGTESNPHPSLTVNTNGPARSPPISTVSPTPSVSNNTTSSASSNLHHLYNCPLLLLFTCIIILFTISL